MHGRFHPTPRYGQSMCHNQPPCRFFLALVCALLLPAVTTAAAGPLQVLRITPSGDDVPPGNQIVIEFDRPMVPLGRMVRDAAELPVRVEPALDCQWRWLNRTALACNLDAAAQLAWSTRYVVRVEPGLEAMDGATLAAPREIEFTTRRPDVTRAHVSEWRGPGVPVLRVVFNQPVTRDSVAASFAFTQRELAPPASGSVAVDVEPEPEDEEPRTDELIPEGVESAAVQRVWLVAPRQALPLDSLVALDLDAGLVSPLGPEIGQARVDILQFHTFPEFRFLGVRCATNAGERVLLAPGTPEPRAPEHMCDPLAPVALSFSTPVLASEVKRTMRFEPDLAGDRDDYDPWERLRDYYTRLGFPHNRGRTYDLPVPERLRAYEAYRVVSPAEVPGLLDTVLGWLGSAGGHQLTDVFGRPLEEPVDLSFWTNHRNPDFTLVHRNAVLESAIDSEVPLYVTNMESVRLDFRRLTGDGAQSDTLSFEVPKVEDVSFAVPLRIRELTGQQTGAAFGAVHTTPEVAKGDWARRFFAQVTPYQVHVKAGHFNTLVWVTDLETGEVVADADVTVYRDALTSLDPPPADAITAVTDAGGVALLPGLEALDPDLETFHWRCDDDCEKLMIRVDGERGMALLPLNDDFRANIGRASNYQIYPNRRKQYGHMRAWGTTAQGVYRAGDTIQFKIYVRDQSNEHYVPAPTQGYTLTLTDPTGKTVHEVENIALNAFGALAGEYTVPESAVMGWYAFELKAEFTDQRWWPMRVLVSDFTPASFRVTSELNGDLFRPGDTLVASSRALLHSGGAYTQAEARITIGLTASGFRSRDPVARAFTFDTANERNRVQLQQTVAELGADGALETAYELGTPAIVYGNLRVESAVRDDRGKYVAGASSARFVALDRFVGLKRTRWLFNEDEPAVVEYLTVDETGAPVADTAVAIVVERLETKTARVRGAGNAYTTSYTESWEPAGTCSGTPQREPLSCTFTPADPGRYRIVAKVDDTQGRAHSTTLTAWVAGKGRVVWREDTGNALELVAEATEYHVGDTARVLVKNPYPGATALLTLERYGVLRQWQTTLEGSTPVLEIPVGADLVPGAYLSVLVFSPRAAEPPAANAEGAGELDLGKPAFRIGYLELPVVDPVKQIAVTAAADREVYRPGETVSVELGAVPGGSDPAEPVEYAVVVLDEAVLDLIAGGSGYFDPYEGFNGLDGLDVENYSLLLRLVGMQKFEKKGANSGGDGGDGLSMRSLFKYVAYWNPSLEADAGGAARFDFELPDNLTGWRILALAVTPTDRFGLGEASFRSNQPTEIRPVMPNQVAEGDGFSAGFSVMNRTDAARTLSVTLEANGDVDAGAAQLTSEVTLEPYERQTVYLPVVAARLPVRRDVTRGTIRFSARAGDASDTDALAHDVPVLKRRALDVAASYGSLTQGAVTEAVVLPEDIYPDAGEISVVLAPSVIGNVEGAFRYLRDYPYACWEQKLTRGVMAAHFNSLAGRLDPTLEWPESSELPAAMLAQAANHQAPNGGMTYYVPLDQNVSPYLSAYTALAFNWLRDAGHTIPARVEERLHGYLLNLLRRDDVPDYYSRGMSATVRAVALNALAGDSKVGLADLRRYADHIERMDLFGAANFMDAALKIGAAEDLVEAAVAHVLARSNTSGGKLTFNDEVDAGYARILTTPLRSNCAVLSALTRVSDLARFGLAETPSAMTRAITQTRGNRDHWENTQENMFCMNALVDYARRYENVIPNLDVAVSVAGTPIGRGRFASFRDAVRTLATPITSAMAGVSVPVAIEREGSGRLYYAARVAYATATENPDPVNAGVSVIREYAVQRGSEWVKLENPAAVKRGELVRVDLFVELPTARNFLVVDDPVPGGLEPVNRSLATSSAVDAQAGDYVAAGGSFWYSHGDWISYGVSRWSFYHREIGHAAVRFYSDYLRPGRYHLAYTAQAVASGTFAAPPTHAEEMYDPDVYGRSRPLLLEVSEP